MHDPTLLLAARMNVDFSGCQSLLIVVVNTDALDDCERGLLHSWASAGIYFTCT